MKLDNPRRVLIGFSIVYFGIAFFIPVYTPFLRDLYFSSFNWEQWLVVRFILTGMAALASLLLWLFYRLWLSRYSRGLLAVIVTGFVLPVVIVEIPRELLLLQAHHADILAEQIRSGSRLLSMEDEELLSASGRPIGVRLRYKVHYPEGGEIIAHIPPATLSTAPAGYLSGFVEQKMDVHTLNSTDYIYSVDLVPDFMPAIIRFPGDANGPQSTCFNWRHGAQGNPASRAAVLASPPQTIRIELGIPHYSAPTRHTYSLHRFYESAKQEGARECS